jgi:SAM-dependent methyltransferase
MDSEPSGRAPYDEDLAFIQGSGFGELAAAAASAVIPELRTRRARRVIDVGCGAGVSTRALVEAGFETLAIDPSGALLDLARRAAPSARFYRASAYDVVLERCDAILALGEALSYHAPTDDAEARLQRFFHGAGRALGTGGLFVLDLIETGELPLDGRAWKTGLDWAVLSASKEDAERRRLTRHIETFREVRGTGYRRRCEIHEVRLFDRDDVCAWLAQAGFVVETRSSYGSFALPRRRVAFYATRR